MRQKGKQSLGTNSTVMINKGKDKKEVLDQG